MLKILKVKACFGRSNQPAIVPYFLQKYLMKVQKMWNDEKYFKDIFEELSKKKENGITRGKKNTEVGLTKYSVINNLNS